MQSGYTKNLRAFMRKNSIVLSLVFFALFGTGVSLFAAAPDTEPYQPGETLDPTCIPGSSVNCTVRILPSQIGNAGKFLTTNGTTTSWASVLTSPSFSDVTLTGNTTFPSLSTAGGILYTNGSGVLAQSAAGIAGQAIISGGATGPIYFAPASGSILFAGTSGILSENPSNFFWDDTNNRLGLGTNTPATLLNIGTGTPTTAANGIQFGTDVLANLYRNDTGNIKTDGVLNVGDQLNVGNSLDLTGNLYSRGDLRLLNKAENGWIDFATRNTTGSEALYNLSNIGTLFANQINSSGTISATLPSGSFGTIASFGANGAGGLINIGYEDGSGISSITGSPFGPFQIASSSNNNILIMPGSGNVGIGSIAPSALFSVGSSNGFQVNNSGDVIANDVTLNSINGMTLGSNAFTSTAYYPNANPSNYIPLTALSSSATGLTYTNTSGVFSLTSGYTIPTTTSQTNWDTAYTNRITSLTTTGTSGAATLSANTLNIPTYTLAGLLPSLTSGSVLFSNGTTVAQDNSNFFWDDTNNRLGLGTVSPTNTLNVKNLSADPVLIEGANGNTTLTGYSLDFSRNSANYIWAKTAGGDLRFTVNGNAIGSPSMVINNTGNVGIGTMSPTARLDVNGSASINNGVLNGGDGLSVGTGFRVTRNSGAAFFNLERTGAGANGNILYTAGSVGLNSASTRVLFSKIDMYSNIHTSGSEVGEIRFNNLVSGVATDVLNIVGNNVGIGTTNPAYKLDVVTSTNDTARFYGNSGTALVYIGVNGTLASASSQFRIFGNSGIPLTLGANGVSNHMFISTTGNVGISTTTPSAQLQVNASSASTIGSIIRGAASQTVDLMQWQDSTGTVLADVTSTGQFQGIAGTASAPTYSFNGFSNNGMYRAASDTIGFSTASAERMRIGSTGNVGIGTTTLTERFTVRLDQNTSTVMAIENATNGTAARSEVRAGVAGVSTVFGSAQSNYTALSELTSSGYIGTDSGLTNGFVFRVSAGPIRFNNGSTEAMRISSGGFVGIGTTNPSTSLHVVGTAGTTGLLQLQGTQARTVFKTAAGTVKGGFGIGSDEDRLFLGNSTTEVISILQNNNVGINTTTPGAQLQVNASSASTIGSIIRGAASQTANLLEWQSSAGTIIGRVEASGNLTMVSGNLTVSNGNASIVGTLSQTGGYSNASIIHSIGTTNSTASGSYIGSSVGINFVPTSGNATATAISVTPTINQTGSASGITRGIFINPTITAAADWRSLQVNTGSATGRGIIVQGATSQTANLTEWQNSGGTVLSSIDSSGRLGVNTAPISSSMLSVKAEGSAGSTFPVWVTNSTNGVLFRIRDSGTVTFASNAAIGWDNSSLLINSSDGVIRLSNNNVNDFSRLQFGGTTNSYNAISRDVVNGFSIQSAAGTATYNDASTAASGTVANRYIFGIAAPTLTSTNAVTNTVASTLFIGGAPTASTNTTIGTALALNVNSGNSFFGGSVGIGTTSPTSAVQVVGRTTTSELYVSNGNAIYTSSGSVGIGTTSPGSQLQINTASASTIGQIIRASASQTANLTEWQNSTGTVLSIVNASGNFGIGTSTATYKLDIQDTTDYALRVRGTSGGGIIMGSISATEGAFWSAGVTPSVSNYSGYYAPTYTGFNSPGSLGLYFNIQGSGVGRWTSSGLYVGSGALTAGAQLQVNASSASTIGSIIRGAASQTADLMQWQDSAGTVLSSINSSGNLLINGSAAPGVTVRANTGATRSLTLGIGNNGTRAEFGMAAGLTAGFTVVSSGGWNNFGVSNEDGAVARVTIGNNGIGLASTRFFVNIGTASHVGQVVRGAASQTADLMQWQDSTGTVLSAVDSTGRFTAGGAGANTLTMRSDRAQIFVNGSTATATGPFIDFDANSTVTAGTTFYRFGTGTMSGALSGNNIIIASNPTINPAAGSGVFRMMDLNYTTNASGAQAGSVTGLRINRNVQGGSTAFTTDMLADFQAAGSSMFSVRADGVVTIASSGYLVTTTIYSGGGGTTAFGNRVLVGTAGTTTAQLETRAASATTIPLFVRGAASQTADLQQWQDSSGTVLAEIDASGRLGIGTTTPTESLETTGSIIAGQGLSFGKGLTNTSLGFGFGRNFSTGAMFDSGRFGFQFTRPGNADRLQLEVYNGSGALITGNALVVNSAANVGIGIASPAARLDVRGGDIYVFDGNDRRFLVGDSPSGGQYGGFRWQTLDDSVSFGHSNSSVNVRNIVVESDGDILMNAGITGNVGIGNTTPAEKLDIVGNFRGQNSITNNTAKDFAVVLGHYTNTEESVSLFTTISNATQNIVWVGGGSASYNAATDIRFFTAADNITTTGTERMRISGNGNVGIGTTNPDSPLHIMSGTTAKLTLSTSDYVLASTGSRLRFGFGASTGNTYSTIQATSTGGSAINNLILNPDGGNVGIGIASPAYRLDVIGSATSGVSAALQVTGGTGTSAGGLRLGAFNASYGAIWSANVVPGASNYAFVSNGSDTILNTTTNGGLWTNGGTPALVWSAIGTTVGSNTYGQGQLAVISANASRQVLVARGITSQTADLTQWQDSAATILASISAAGNFTINTSTARIFLGNGSSQAGIQYDSGATGLILRSNRISASGSDITISSGQGSVTATSGANYRLSTSSGASQQFAPISGNATWASIGILETINQTGTANGITRGLFVNNTVTAAVDYRAIETNVASGTGRYGYYGAGTAVSYFGGNVGVGTTTPGYSLEVGNASVSGVVARFVNSSGSCDINPTTTSLSCSSDQTLKKNITSLSDEFLTKVTTLRPVTYNWNTEIDGTTSHVGFIAQEVEQIFPDLVATDSVTGLKSVNYIGFIPYITKAVIEQNIKIGLLEDRVTNLENIINGTPGLIGGAMSGIKNLVVDTLKVGTPEKRTGITIYDEATGAPFCVKVVNGGMQTVPGECGVVSAPTVNQAPDPSPIVSPESEVTPPQQEEMSVVENNSNPSNEVINEITQ